VPSARSAVNASAVHEGDDDDDNDDDIEGNGIDDCETKHTKKTNRRDNDDDHADTDITTARNLKRNRSAL